MRITIIAFAYLEYTIELANALSKTERVLLIIPQKKSGALLELINPRVDTVVMNFPRIRSPRNLYYVLKTVKRLHTFKPHVIHFQGGFLWYNAALPFLGNCPLVTTIHDPNVHIGDWQSRKMVLFKPNSLAVLYSRRLIVHGKDIKDAFLKAKCIKSEQISVIPHGEFSIYNRWITDTVNEENNLVLFFGRIWEYKGLEYLIDAEPYISKEIPNLKIIIAGVGEPIDKYLDRIKNPEHFLIYNYFVPNNMVAWLFQKTSLVVLPYVECSQSGVIPLAYSFGKPVVATRVGSIPEIIENDMNGLLVPPKDSRQLAGAVIDLLKNDSKRKMLGKNGHQKMKNEFSWDRIAQMTIDVYRDAWEDSRKK
jgi:glycosyltransferase involved in cell wall biosynthesis